jgi:hypothetical protein
MFKKPSHTKRDSPRKKNQKTYPTGAHHSRDQAEQLHRNRKICPEAAQIQLGVSGNTSRTKALVSCCVVMVGTKWYHRDRKWKWKHQ